MNRKCTFYLCTTCYVAGAAPRQCHGRAALWCDAGEPGSERRKPLQDATGRLLTAAPRWYLEATGQLPPILAQSAQSA